jgi:hypothetical protein
MIPIGIPGDKDKIASVPPPPFQVPAVYGEEIYGI